MNKVVRGRVLRDTSSGEGLLFVDGRQVAFRLEGHWKSDMAPKLNMVVDVELDAQDSLVGVKAVDPQTLASEQAAQALASAQDAARRVAGDFQARGLPLLIAGARQFGFARLGALALLLLGWFELPTITLQLGIMGNKSLTFFDCVKLLGAPNLQDFMNLANGSGSFGLYGFLCVASLVGVFLPNIWSDPRARYGLLGPLAVMVLVVLVAYIDINAQLGQANEAAKAAIGGTANNPVFGDVMRDVRNTVILELRKSISIGSGLWLSFASATYLALQSFSAPRRQTA